MTSIIKDKLYNLIRYNKIIEITGNLGEITENDEKIICHINKRKCKKENNRYLINCKGINEVSNIIAKNYNINKPICYLIDNLSFFNDKVKIIGDKDTEIIIKNSKFNCGLKIKTLGKCILENTDIYEEPLLLIDTKEILLNKIYIFNHYALNNKELEINIHASENIKIVDSSIGNIRLNNISNIYCEKELSLINSEITGDDITILAEKITCDDSSSIVANNNIEINLDSEYDLNQILPKVTFNNIYKVKTKKKNNL